jgi:hypothetical protein
MLPSLLLALLAVVAVSALPLKDEFETKGVVLLDSITFPKVVPSKVATVVLVANKAEIGDYATDSMRSDYFAFSYKAQTHGNSDDVLFTQVI